MAKKNPFWKRPSNKAPAPAGKSPLRPRAEVQDEYNKACNEAGDLQYKLVAMSQRIDWLTQFRGQLNAEMAAIDQAEAEKAAAQLPTAPPPPLETQH